MGLFDMSNPQSMGLLSAGLNMMANSGPSSQRKSFGQIAGQGGMAGMQQYTDMQQAEQVMAMRKAMLEQQAAQQRQQQDNWDKQFSFSQSKENADNDYRNRTRQETLDYQNRTLAQQEELRKADQALRAQMLGFQQEQARHGKTPAGYRETPEGNLEPIPGGPSDAKAQALLAQKATGASDVDIAVSTLRDAYDRLEKGGGITSTNKGSLGNLGAAMSASDTGQYVGKMFGTDNQSARNDIAMTRPALLGALMKATGMSAKQMDSNAELKLWLATATDPTLDVESNRRALANIEKKYMSGGNAQPPNPSSPSNQSSPEKSVVRTGVYGGRKIVQYSDGSVDYAN